MYNFFHIYDPDLKNDVYLLDYWGAAEDGKVSKWIQTLTTVGVGGVNVNFLPVCNFEFNNLACGGKAVLNSIMI